MKANRLLKHILDNEKWEIKIISDKKTTQNRTDFENQQIILIPDTFNGNNAEAYRVVTHEAGHVCNNEKDPKHYKTFNRLRNSIPKVAIIAVILNIIRIILAIKDIIPTFVPILGWLGWIFTIISISLNIWYTFVVYKDESNANKFGKELLRKYYKNSYVNNEVTLQKILDQYQKNDFKLLKHPYVIVIICLSTLILLLMTLVELIY